MTFDPSKKTNFCVTHDQECPSLSAQSVRRDLAVFQSHFNFIDTLK